MINEIASSTKLNINVPFQTIEQETLKFAVRKMNTQNKTIKSILTGYLLLVFTIAIAPKQFLHFLFAGHTDQKLYHTEHKFLFTTHAYNCQIEDQVVEIPFLLIEYPKLTRNLNFTLYSDFEELIPQEYIFSNRTIRGPPELI